MSAQPVAANDAVTRPPLKYYGGKAGHRWQLADWIISHFPPHAHYIEPFAGGMSVLLRKEPSRLETANDLDGDLVTFFRVLRERTDELVRAIELTPFAHAEHDLSYTPAADDLERARRLYVRSWQGRGGGRGSWRSGWRRTKNPYQARPIEAWQTVDQLYAIAARLRQVQIECDDALNVICRYDRPDALFYVDPPYLAETRGRWAKTGYAVELNENSHRQLADALRSVRGMVILSGYPSDLYSDLYSDWRTEMRQSRADGGLARTEVLWLNPAAADGRRQPRLLEVL